MNPSRATIPLIRPHQCDSEGGRIRGVLLYKVVRTSRDMSLERMKCGENSDEDGCGREEKERETGVGVNEQCECRLDREGTVG